MYSKIIKNGMIIDGTGKPAFSGDIAIEDDLIVAIGDMSKERAAETIDAQGSFVSPGFIDVQNHSDVYWSIFNDPELQSMVGQGITTILLGQCGASLAPLLSHDALLSVQKWHNLDGANFNWLSFSEYIDELSKRNFGSNIASLVGHETLRRGLLKNEVRSLTESEQKILVQSLQQSLNAGAFGMSVGLSYAHEESTSTLELLSLVQALADSNSLLSIHLRSEGAELIESVEEALQLVSKTGVNAKICHIKAREKSNWHLLPQAISLIENAYQQKSNIHFDVYPYEILWQVLYTYLPKWAYAGGREAMLKILKDPIQRKKVIGYLNSRDIDYSHMVVASTSMSLNVIGKTLGEIGRRHDLEPAEALVTMVENGGSEVMVFDNSLDPKQVEELVFHPLSIVATDGAAFAPETQDRLVHPRCFGNMPKFLNMAIENKNIPLEKAVQKITGTAAKKIGLDKRGVIAVDNFADIVIFDKGIQARSTYVNPFLFPVGIRNVFVNGIAAFTEGKLNGSVSGRALKSR